MANEWADRKTQLNSYELFARYVIPQFQGGADAPRRSRDWVAEERSKQLGRAGEAIMQSIQQHATEQQEKQT
jgi:limonene 1,2-monooxygenase